MFVSGHEEDAFAVPSEVSVTVSVAFQGFNLVVHSFGVTVGVGVDCKQTL